MASRKKRRLLEWGKNALIVLLSLSALYLLGRTQLYTQGAISGKSWLNSLLSALPGQAEPEPGQPAVSWSQGNPVRPVRMVVISPQGRTGIQYNNETLDNLYSGFISTLAEALTEAAPPEKTTAAQFQEALTARTPGVYLDFLGGVPLPNLSAWFSGGRVLNGSLTDTARRLLLTVTEDGEVLLYYINEESGMYYASKTAPELAERLRQFAGDTAPNGAAFAFESGETYAALDPYTLLEGASAPRPGRYSVTEAVPLSNIDSGGTYGAAYESLVRSLSFHLQSLSYPYRDGVTLQEGTEKLRIFNSKITYEAVDLEEPRYPLEGLGADPEPWELVGSAWAFVENVLTPLCGEARLYVIGIEEDQGTSAVLFGYQLDGAPVLVGSDGYAARVEITGGAISGFVLQLRSYTYQEQGGMVLPELQATAALEALGRQGSELMLYYSDHKRDEILTADWGILKTGT